MSFDHARPLRESSSSQEGDADGQQEHDGLSAVELKDGHSNHATRYTDKIPIDIRRGRFPYCIVWGPLPLITWLIPIIGHLGIADSEGRVHDFAGPYYIGVDDFMTPIAKYYQFRLEDVDVTDADGQECTSPAAKQIMWDRAVQQSDGEYVQTMHTIVTNNCHHHTARALRLFGMRDVTMIKAWWLITTKGRYVSWGKLVAVWCPFVFLMTGIILLSVFVRV